MVQVKEGPQDLRVAVAQLGPANARMMTEVPLDELGPVDYLIVEFPAGASSFTGEMAAQLRALADARTSGGPPVAFELDPLIERLSHLTVVIR